MEKMNKKQTSSDRKLVVYKNEMIQHTNFTDKEAANFLRTSTVSLWRARKKGLLTFRRIMGKILYTEADLLDFLERSKRGFANNTEDYE